MHTFDAGRVWLRESPFTFPQIFSVLVLKTYIINNETRKHFQAGRTFFTGVYWKNQHCSIRIRVIVTKYQMQKLAFLTLPFFQYVKMKHSSYISTAKRKKAKKKDAALVLYPCFDVFCCGPQPMVAVLNFCIRRNKHHQRNVCYRKSVYS